MNIVRKPITGPAKSIIGLLLLLLAIKFTPSTDHINNNPSVKGLSTTTTPTLTPTLSSTPTPSLAPTLSLVSTLTNTPVLRPTPAVSSKILKVTKVIDGDTFKIEIEGQEEVVRLIGVDTPETVDPRKPVQCFGKETSAKVKELVEGKNVILDSDPTQGDRDKYNRLLRYVHLEDGAFVNQKLIEDGYGFEYTYNIPYKYRTEFKEAQKQAEANKRGLWADGVCPITTSIPTIKPTTKPQPTSPPPQNNSSGSWACNCSKTCGQITSCDEAYYQLNNCGCSQRDADSDGVPCESLCN